MKKIYLGFFSSVFSLVLLAQGNVGIGTTSPIARLHVVATATNPTAIFDGPSGLYLQLNEGGIYRGYLGSYAGNPEDIDLGTGSGNNSGKLHLTTQAVPRVTINSGGYVGINTLSPAYQMDVLGRIRLQAGSVNNAGTSAGIWFTDYRDNSNIIFAGMADSVNYGFWGQRAGIGWQFFFDARYGNAGIGQKPSTGSMRLVLNHADGAQLGMFTNGAYMGGLSANDSTLQLRGQYQSAFCFPGPCPPAKDIVIWPPYACQGIGCINTPSPGRTGFYNNKPMSKVHIVAGTGTSGVLISSSTTAVPASGYMLNVDGKIICEELRVQTSTAWPDYVFKQGYTMPSLDDLEKQVMATGHLPGIVSAAEVEAAGGGVELGELQRKMLEKMEELYRYVFELNRENKELKAALANQKK